MNYQGIFYQNWDLDATTYKYGRIKGVYPGFGGLSTPGASTTINAVTAGAGTFAGLRVGDYIRLQLSETSFTQRQVLTKPTPDQITVSGANLNFTNLSSWYFLPFDIGATDADGALSTEGYNRVFIEFDIPTIAAAGGVDYSIEVRGRGTSAKWKQVITGNYAATPPNPGVIEVTEIIGSVRVGVKGNAGFAGTDDISVYLVGKPAVVR